MCLGLQAGIAAEPSKGDGCYCESQTVGVLREAQTMKAWLLTLQKEAKTLPGLSELF